VALQPPQVLVVAMLWVARHMPAVATGWSTPQGQTAVSQKLQPAQMPSLTLLLELLVLMVLVLVLVPSSAASSAFSAAVGRRAWKAASSDLQPLQR